MIPRSLGFLTLWILSAGCQSAPPPPVPPAVAPHAATEPPTMNAVPDRDSLEPAVVFLGTSLTAGYGLPDQTEAFPALIQRKLDSLGLKYRVVNAGVSGETSAGALRRMDWLLSRERVALLVVETGANDGLRGQNPDTIEATIRTILDRARALDPPPRLVLAGMEAPPNLGAEYTRRFHAIYPTLAKAYGIALVPFLLEGVAGIDSLNQADGIHPTARGHRIVAENVWRVIEPLLEKKR